MNTLIKKYKAISLPARAALWFAFCGMLQKGIQFITTPIFTRLLTTAEYGEVSVYLSWYNIISIFTTLNLYMGGFNNGMIQNEDRRDEYLSSMQGLITIVSLGLYCLYLISSRYWNAFFEMNTLTVTVMFTEILIHSSLLFWSARARFEYNYRKLIAYTIPIVTIPPFASILAMLFIKNYNAALVKIYSNAFFVILLCLPIYYQNIKRGRSFYDKKFWLFGLKFNTPLIPHYLSGIVLNQADRIMIQKMVGNSEAGIYSLAYSASMVLNVVTTALNQSLSPWIYGKIKEKQYSDIKRISNPIFAAMAVVIFILVVFAPECIIFFGGSSYSSAIWIVPSVATSLYFLFVYQVYANIEFYYMKNMYITYASVTGAVLNILLNYIGIKLFGYIAAGYTTLICYVIFYICHCLFVRKIEKECIGGIQIFDNKFSAITGGLLVICGHLMLYLYNYPIIRYCLLCGIMGAIYYKRKKIRNLLGEFRNKDTNRFGG